MTFTLIGTVAGSIIFILTTIGLPGLLALMIVESFGIPPIPSEIILPFTGFLIVTGVFPLIPAVLLALAGGLIGSYAAFAVGWWWRERITGIGIGPIRLEERHLARVDRWFSKHGEGTVPAVSNAPGRPELHQLPGGHRQDAAGPVRSVHARRHDPVHARPDLRRDAPGVPLESDRAGVLAAGLRAGCRARGGGRVLLRGAVPALAGTSSRLGGPPARGILPDSAASDPAVVPPAGP